MATSIYIFEEGKPFNYREFAKHLISCPNVNWKVMPGVDCKLEQFIAAVSVELNIGKKEAGKVVLMLDELGFITMHLCNDPDTLTVVIAKNLLLPGK